MSTLTDRGKAFRSAIAEFIDGRREEKLKGKEDDATALAKYEFNIWLADAAKRVGQIQMATHTPKATHPDAKGSSLHINPKNLTSHREIGSHVLTQDFAEDVVGNAAALDVFKFLKTEVDGKRLLEWMQAQDSDLAAALHADPETAQQWMQAFSSLVRADARYSSHSAAKQLYWLRQGEAHEDQNYLLLQPLFSSSLAHAVHAEVQDARFGEANKVLRQAFREKAEQSEIYRDYRNLAVRKLGGTKPQNISQLNSERGGVNYLLPSLPPVWNQERFKPFFNTTSAMERLSGVSELRETLADLILFLKKELPPTVETRDQRKALEQELGAQLVIFACNSQFNLEPGWSRDERCELSLHQKIWLDPERVFLPLREEPELKAEDEAFIAEAEWGDWPDQVASDFAKWVNARLTRAGIAHLGDVEYRHWARQAIVEAAWPAPWQRRAVQGGGV